MIKKISRSAIEQYLKCKKCFVLQCKYKIRPRSIPFTLNLAVDNLCKNEFDYYRKKQEPHPFFIDHGIDAVPFNHPDIERWRNNFQGIRYIDKEQGYDFGGAVDDVWVKPSGELIIADVKATAKKDFNWEETYKQYEWPKGYKRQLEMYQWLFRKNGFQVANEAYLVYYNGLKSEPFFKQSLKFELHLVKLDCNTDWVEEKVIEASKLLHSDNLPESSFVCENCDYLRKREKISQDID